MNKMIRAFKCLMAIFKTLGAKISAIEDKISSSPDKVTKELDEASKFKKHCEEPENCEYCSKRRWISFHIIHAIVYFITGIIFNYAPRYIGTQENWIINKGDAGGYVSLIFFIGATYELYYAYPHIFTHLNAYFLFMLTGTVAFYAGVMDLSAKYEPMREYFKLMSFLMLGATIMSIAMISPRLIDWWEENKKNVKSLFKLKKVSGFILGALAVGTAIFQFIQVLLSLIHH